MEEYNFWAMRTAFFDMQRQLAGWYNLPAFKVTWTMHESRLGWLLGPEK